MSQGPATQWVLNARNLWELKATDVCCIYNTSTANGISQLVYFTLRSTDISLTIIYPTLT